MINPKERMGLIPAMFLELNEMKTETRNPSGSFGVKPCSFQARKNNPTTYKETHIRKQTKV
jgi:hypothetical protein